MLRLWREDTDVYAPSLLVVGRVELPKDSCGEKSEMPTTRETRLSTSNPVSRAASAGGLDMNLTEYLGGEIGRFSKRSELLGSQAPKFADNDGK